MVPARPRDPQANMFIRPKTASEEREKLTFKQVTTKILDRNREGWAYQAFARKNGAMKIFFKNEKEKEHFLLHRLSELDGWEQSEPTTSAIRVYLKNAAVYATKKEIEDAIFALQLQGEFKFEMTFSRAGHFTGTIKMTVSSKADLDILAQKGLEMHNRTLKPFFRTPICRTCLRPCSAEHHSQICTATRKCPRCGGGHELKDCQSERATCAVCTRRHNTLRCPAEYNRAETATQEDANRGPEDATAAERAANLLEDMARETRPVNRMPTGTQRAGPRNATVTAPTEENATKILAQMEVLGERQTAAMVEQIQAIKREMRKEMKKQIEDLLKEEFRKERLADKTTIEHLHNRIRKLEEAAGEPTSQEGPNKPTNSTVTTAAAKKGAPKDGSNLHTYFAKQPATKTTAVPNPRPRTRSVTTASQHNSDAEEPEDRQKRATEEKRKQTPENNEQATTASRTQQ
eukprot:GILJ01014322.1.p1 GENE.GILJ01014322.1~~GILJ01014322.1.p1  ORF type:complete len:461 (-),score=59.33 GILJ01014322.1:2180-3562(-)